MMPPDPRAELTGRIGPVASPMTTKRRRKFSSVLAKQIDTRKIDLKSVGSWLADFLKLENTPHDKFISALVMDYLRAHRTPDGKVIQVELSDLGLLKMESVERLMKKLWARLAWERVEAGEHIQNTLHGTNKVYHSRIQFHSGTSEARKFVTTR